LSFKEKLISLANRQVAFNDFVEASETPKKDPSGEITEDRRQPVKIHLAGISKKYKQKIETLQSKIGETSKQDCMPYQNPEIIRINSNPDVDFRFGVG
jgi:hypothetical protein